MPNKTISYMMTEKNTIIKRITDPLKFVDLTREIKEGDSGKRTKINVYKRAIAPFVGAKEFAGKSLENQNALLEFSNQFSEVWGEMLHKVEALYLYKAACIEHRKMAASDKVPESYKKISKNCILEIEQTLKENGFTKDMLKQALEEDHFENMFLSDYTKKIEEMYISFSKDHKLPLNEKITSAAFTDALMHHTNKVEKGTVRMVTNLDTLIADPIAPQVAFAKSGLSYFDSNYENDVLAREPRDYNKDYDDYKFFEMKDGKFVDKPAPSGFFNKIAFYFKKYFWDADDWDREKKRINTELEKEQEELAKIPEDIDAQIVAYLAPMSEEEVNALEIRSDEKAQTVEQPQTTEPATEKHTETAPARETDVTKVEQPVEAATNEELRDAISRTIKNEVSLNLDGNGAEGRVTASEKEKNDLSRNN